MKKIIMMSAAVLLVAFAQADTIVQWGIYGGDTAIVTANTNGTRLPFTFIANSNLNPAVGANYYPANTGRSPVYNGACSITVTNGIENAVAQNVGGDNIRTRQTMAAGSNVAAMVLWESTNFVTSGLTVTNFSIQLASAHANNIGSLNWLVEKGGTYYISSQSVAFSGTGWTSASVGDASTLTWNTFTPFTNGVATIGSATNITLGNVTSLGYYFNVTNGDAASQLTGAASKFFLAGGSTNPPADPLYYTLTGSAGANGTVSPASTNVPPGGSADFVITADSSYRIASLTINGTDVPGMSFDSNSTTTNFTWSNVRAAGTLAATFTAQVSTPPHTIVQWGVAGGDTNIVTATTVNNSGKLPGTFTAGAKLNNPVGASYYPANTGRSPVYNGASSLTGKLENVIVNNVGGDNIRNRNNTAAGSNLSAMVVWEHSNSFVNTGLTTIASFSIEFAGAQSNNTGSLNWLVEKGGTYYISSQSVAFSGVGWTSASVRDASTLTWNTFTPFTNGVATIGSAMNITLDNVTSLGYYFDVVNGDGTTNQQAGVATRFFSAGDAVYYTLTVTGGSGSGSSYTNTQVVAISADAPATGTTFDKWIGDTQYVNNVTYTNALVTMPTNAVSLSATYKTLPGYYTLTVNNGSGGGLYTNGQQVAISASSTSRTFVAWIGDTQYVDNVAASPATVTMPVSTNGVTLTATYDQTILTVVNGLGSGTYNAGNYVEITANDPRLGSGVTFKDWAGATQYVDYVTASPAHVTMPMQDITVRARYYYSLTITNGSGAGSYTNNARVDIVASTLTGKTFAQWIGDTNLLVSNTLSTTVNMTTNPASLTATYANIPYMLTVNGGNGTGSAYTYGESVPISADAPGAGLVFDKWTGDTAYLANSNSASTTVTMPAANIAVASSYKSAAVTLTATAGAGGTITPASASVSPGNSTNFVITANNYYRISTLTTNGVSAGLSFNNLSTNYNFVWSNVQAAGTVTVSFVEQVTTGPAPVPYSWLAQYFVTNDYNAAALADQDADGAKTWQEYIANTVPTNKASVFTATQATRNVITWNAQSNRIYSVYWTTNLVTKAFTNKQDNVVGGAYTNTSPDSRVNLYQVRVRIQ